MEAYRTGRGQEERKQKSKVPVKSTHLLQNRKPPLWPLTFAFCLLTFGFCFAFLSAPPAKAPQSDRALPGVVELLAVGPGDRARNRECEATGFLINEDGYLITNAHVVADLRRCLSADPGGEILAKLPAPGEEVARGFACEVVGLDEVHDLAVLRMMRPLASTSRTFAFIDPHEPAEGTPVSVTGHPEFAWQPQTQFGHVVRLDNYRLGPAGAETTKVLVLDIRLLPGNSGSPVYLESGGVVGVVVQRDQKRQDHSVAISAGHIVEMLDRYGVKRHGPKGRD